MKGDIYTEQRCFICQGKLIHNEKRNGLFCLEHPQVAANAQFIVRFGRKTTKRFQSYELAAQFLNGCRFKTSEGSFDVRDYQKDAPLGFMTLSTKWLELKKKTVKHKHYANLKRYIGKAVQAWGQKNIKTIGYSEIEDFLFNQDVSEKTRANMKSCLHDFWGWLKKRKILRLDQMPEFPEVAFELGWRKIVDKATQEQLIDEIYRISYHHNQKIWIGIKWLSTYISMRPGEMLNLKESEIDTKLGCLIIPHPKDKEPKLIYLLDEDIEILNKIPRGLPNLYFFRHPSGISGVKAGERFGSRYLYKWWKKACDNLGIEGVDLYGGTRHSTTTALSQVLTPEQIKQGSLHKTNKAFERYMQTKSKDALMVYRTASNLTKKGEIIKLDRKDGS